MKKLRFFFQRVSMYQFLRQERCGKIPRKHGQGIKNGQGQTEWREAGLLVRVTKNPGLPQEEVWSDWCSKVLMKMRTAMQNAGVFGWTWMLASNDCTVIPFRSLSNGVIPHLYSGVAFRSSDCPLDKFECCCLQDPGSLCMHSELWHHM